jgi:hypothetical protein
VVFWAFFKQSESSLCYCLQDSKALQNAIICLSQAAPPPSLKVTTQSPTLTQRTSIIGRTASAISYAHRLNVLPHHFLSGIQYVIRRTLSIARFAVRAFAVQSKATNSIQLFIKATISRENPTSSV